VSPRVRTVLRSLVAALAVLLLAGCGTVTAAGDAAATVDGVAVSRSQLESGVREIVGDVEALDPEERGFRVGTVQRHILGFQIQGAIFERLADEQGITIDEADLDAARNRLLEATGGQEQLDQLIAREGLTPTLFEELILPQEVRIAELAEVVGPEQINPYLVEEIRGADVAVAPGLGRWDPEQLRVVEPSTVGGGEPVAPGLG
jgi:outer membrane murein-binding lipoprotein Lpp